jgi:hypothetical protein
MASAANLRVYYRSKTLGQIPIYFHDVMQEPPNFNVFCPDQAIDKEMACALATLCEMARLCVCVNICSMFGWKFSGVSSDFNERLPNQ